MIGLAEHMVIQNKNPLHFPEVQRKKNLSWFKRRQDRVIATTENFRKKKFIKHNIQIDQKTTANKMSKQIKNQELNDFLIMI